MRLLCILTPFNFALTAAVFNLLIFYYLAVKIVNLGGSLTCGRGITGATIYFLQVKCK